MKYRVTYEFEASNDGNARTIAGSMVPSTINEVPVAVVELAKEEPYFRKIAPLAEDKAGQEVLA